jgi:molybdenum cofactor cytidylyltransferase
MISAILLAAGESKRMGAFKQLLMFEGKTFVQCCADNLLAAGVGEVIVVTGHREADVRFSLKDRAIRFAHNENFREGMSSSIRRGVEAISEGSKAVLIALGDQPQIGPGVIRLLIETYAKHRSPIVVPVFRGRKGHPVIFDISLKEEILSVDPAEGLRQIVQAHSDKILRVEVANDAVIFDFDFPEDYSRAGGQ